MEDDDLDPYPLLSSCLHEYNPISQEEKDDDDEEDEDSEDDDEREDSEEAPCNFSVPMSAMMSDSLESNNDIEPNPLYFHHNSFKETNLPPKLQCFVCSKLHTSFFCYSCIRNGEFTSSQCAQALKERFGEKKLRLYKLEEDRMDYCDRIEYLLKDDVEVDRLRMKVNQHHLNIETLKGELVEKRMDLERDRKRLEEIKALQQLSKKQPNSQKIAMTKDIVSKCRDRIQARSQKRLEIETAIRDETNTLVRQLRECIFNVDKFSSADHETNLAQEETVPLLAYDSASSGSGYELATETRYIVVEPWISLNADYSTYNEWGNSNCQCKL